MRYIIIILVTMCVFTACSEDKFTTRSTRYLYFAKGITTIVSPSLFSSTRTRPCMIFGWSYCLPGIR
ncbi:MAG: hypothetical protein ACLSDJ_06940 [Butyricimonas faecihominis]